MLSHAAVVKQAAQAYAATQRATVINGFIASLGSRDLPARSAFGSFVVLQHFQTHAFVPSRVFAATRCAACGLPEQSLPEREERVARYPFQVQHTDINYAAFDLATCASRIARTSTADDRARLAAIFARLRALPATAQLSDLQRALQGVIAGNKYERQILLETFGYAGILCPKDQQHYTAQFVTYDAANSAQPQHASKREWAYPLRFWTGTDGVNEALVQHFFGAI